MRLRELQAHLVDLQNWVIENRKKVVIVFEGRDAAGKGGAIRRITAHINRVISELLLYPNPMKTRPGSGTSNVT